MSPAFVAFISYWILEHGNIFGHYVQKLIRAWEVIAQWADM
jgi:hypothetical protein